MKKRLTITLSESVLENLEKNGKRDGVVKICTDFSCLGKLQERSSEIKKSRAGRRLFKSIITWVNYNLWLKKSKILHFFTLSRVNP